MAPEGRLRLPEPGSFEDLLCPVRIEIASLVRLSRHPTSDLRPPSPTGRQGSTALMIQVQTVRARLARKLKAEKLKARQVDDLCDRFNVTAV